MPPDEPTDEEREEQLSQDYQTPFSPPDDTHDVTATGQRDDVTAYPTDPATDTGIQLEELYDEGPVGASEMGQPSDSSIISYTPSRKQSSDN